MRAALLSLGLFVLAMTIDSVPPVAEAGVSTGRDLLVTDVSAQAALERAGLPVTWKGASFFLAEWDAAQQKVAAGLGIEASVLLDNSSEEQDLYLFELDDEATPKEWEDHVLYRKGRDVVVVADESNALRWIGRAGRAVRLPRVARGFEPAAAELVTFDCSSKPVVTDLLARTNQAQWLDWIEKISGEEPVTIGGAESTIRTRYSTYLFAGDSTARAFDFALEQIQSWSYPPSNVEQDPFTGSGGQTWKNLIVTIPGQTAPNEIVLLTGHYDSRSGTLPSPVAPGANDNGTGSATLFEALRLLRQFRFARTVRVVFFTGNEQGLYGSSAYVQDHSTANVLGVVNLDRFGWDGNSDRCFEIHAGTLAQSQEVGSCFASSIASYGLNLSRDVLTTTATNSSDHASFWQVNVGAVEIGENFFNDNLAGGCVGSDPDPSYDTTNDTIASNLAPSYAFDIARAGLATIAAMAVPIEACFPNAPALSAAPGVSNVDLSWSAVEGASAYRIFRSTQGCQGQWLPLGETSTTALRDSAATQARSYAYYVEAVAADGFCVSAMSNCVQATPTIYHATATSRTLVDSCPTGGPGHGNGVVEPGETVRLAVILTNDGNASLTGIAGTLSTPTPGVTVVDAAATWPDLAPNASAESLPDHFGLELGPEIACGTNLDAVISVAYGGRDNATPVTIPTGSTAQSVLLNETFDSGIPASWTVVDGGIGGGTASTWTGLNPGGRVIAAPFAGAFAIVDSDKAGQTATQDEQLVTPMFDACGCSQVTLEWSNQFRWYSGGQNETADVDISSNGGSTWTNVLRMQEGSDGYPTPNTRTLDLTSAIAANRRNVKVRFRYAPGSFEWFWAIDNVKVTCVSPVCNVCEPEHGAPGEAGASTPVEVSKSGANLRIDWGAPPSPCRPRGYSVYRGDLTTLAAGSYSHHTALVYRAATPSLLIPLADARLGNADYFLVTADTGAHEGSYGRSSSGSERPVSNAACAPAQNLSACAP